MNRVGRRTGPASLCEAERPRLCLPREATGRRHRPQPRRRALAGHRTCGRSGLGLPASSADRNKHLLFKPPRPSCFVMENYPRQQCVHQEAAGTLAATRPERKAGPLSPAPSPVFSSVDTTPPPAQFCWRRVHLSGRLLPLPSPHVGNVG